MSAWLRGPSRQAKGQATGTGHPPRASLARPSSRPYQRAASPRSARSTTGTTSSCGRAAWSRSSVPGCRPLPSEL